MISIKRSSSQISLFTLSLLSLIAAPLHAQDSLPYEIVDTGQILFYNNSAEITEPAAGSNFYGQDAHYDENQPAYQNNGDGTITDLNTGLMWQKTPDLVNQSTFAEAVAMPQL